MAGRPRDANKTRAELLTAARAQFAREGFERVTIRSVAAEVGVDPALVMRYFTNKAGLFAEAARMELDIPDLAGLEPEEIATTLVDRFFVIFEEHGNFLALLRSAATSPEAAERMRDVLLERAQPMIARAAVDRPSERAAMVGSQMLGFAFARYIIGVPALVQMDRAQVRAWIGPTVARYLTDPALGVPPA
ncbi:MAG: TetR family transcriptional regulator [Pseudonocardia sp.]|nr:TetR family transcriptional regulator [Pseudonocardia sp.]